ncbi:MAG: response regulator [Lachnospiraceae bacterium]|jgi:two-component system chemotaxis response regulator CheY|nr:response regulator [Lachnospiraceae bacterium]
MEAKEFKILVADDSLLARKKLITNLNELGYNNIFEAADGEEAVNKYKEEQPNLIFMDIVMPKQYGLDALKEIMDINPNVIVIMVSTTGTKKNITDALKVGAADFILKPFTKSQITAVLQKYNR